jgi:hypothetical protein
MLSHSNKYNRPSLKTKGKGEKEACGSTVDMYDNEGEVWDSKFYKHNSKSFSNNSHL